jgi:hypothetical protein
MVIKWNSDVIHDSGESRTLLKKTEFKIIQARSFVQVRMERGSLKNVLISCLCCMLMG